MSDLPDLVALLSLLLLVVLRIWIHKQINPFPLGTAPVQPSLRLPESHSPLLGNLPKE